MKKVHHKLNLKQIKRPLKSSKKEHLVKLNLDFGKIKVGLIKQILMDGFNGILDSFLEENFRRREKKKNRREKIVSRFKGKLVKMIKDPGGEFDDYSISPKISQIILHWGYELTEKDFLPTQQII